MLRIMLRADVGQ